MSEVIRACVIIPIYNHGATLAGVIRALPSIPIFVVDDGSGAETKQYIADAARTFAGITVLTRAKNGGKGAAFKTGICAARAAGFTHALQIDADGQHDGARAAFFFIEAAKHPSSVIAGLPQFDGTAPKGRLRGRSISNIWAKIVTLSSALPDVLCGFRVYPVAPACEIMCSGCVDPRMGFDTEILVRLFWAGVPVIFHPVAVRYPEDGVSHFHYVRDNLHISWMFTRLFFGMLRRLPRLLCRRRSKL